MSIKRTPQRIVGDDAYMQLVFEGYAVVKADELSQLRKALKPFAREADRWEPKGDAYWPDSAPFPANYNSSLTIGDFRRARALSEREGQDG